MIQLGVICDPRLRLKRAIPVVEGKENGDVVLWSRPLEHFGIGKYRGVAAYDFARSLSSLYWTMKKDQDQLGPSLQRVWKFMQQYIEER